MKQTGSARFRQRKISVKQGLQVLRQSDIPDLEEEQQREIQQVETGVEKGEEEEHHLQAAINASLAAAAGAKVQQIYIPTPDASKIFEGYSKYYTKKFTEPTTYIRFSSTVEDTSGCPYFLDENDFEFLEKINSTKRSASQKCTEDVFEQIMHQFEMAIADRQPFLSTDLSQILSFEELESAFSEFNLPLYINFAKMIYPHWKERRIQRRGRPIMYTLKFEEGDKDDSDPYTCFRRREFRQVRKTRRSDAQSSERLRRLKAEMDAARSLTELVVKRETLRKDSLQLEWDTFKQRNMVKELKRKLGIKGDDEDLISKKKKQNGVDSQIPAVRLAIPKVPEIDLVTLEDIYNKREKAIDTAIEEKLLRRREADIGWEDYTEIVTGWLGIFEDYGSYREN
ncbi:enhancer of polycomb-like-domain-containing protein [Lipomyces doorenjongii]|uniref:enhancer of polycomb-like-domain-containing protein n=1 Tax=Lipomyces doorenjongii TaxID=383834 RepID=UPI0033437A4B